MTEQQIAAMRQALEALNEYCEHGAIFMPITARDTLTAVLADNALDKKAENARDLGLDYEPEQPAQQQEPVAWVNWCAATGKRSVSFECESELASEPLYAGITQNTQGHYSKFHSWFDSELHRQKYTKDHPAYLAAQEAWNAANDDAQHRINRLSAEIEAWKARFKIAEDALVKLNGMEREPVAWMYDIARYGPTDLRGQQWRPAISRIKPNIHDSLVRDLTPLYTHPAPDPVIDKSAAIRIATALGWEPKRQPLTDEQAGALFMEDLGADYLDDFVRGIRAAEAAHGIKGDA